jgi:hypothetical protein
VTCSFRAFRFIPLIALGTKIFLSVHFEFFRFINVLALYVVQWKDWSKLTLGQRVQLSSVHALPRINVIHNLFAFRFYSFIIHTTHALSSKAEDIRYSKRPHFTQFT